MANRSFRRGFQRAYARTRVIVKKVRSYRRPRTSFLQKNKTMLIVVALAGAAWYFRDKIKAIFAK